MYKPSKLQLTGWSVVGLVIVLCLYPEVRAVEVGERPALEDGAITLTVEPEKSEYAAGEWPKVSATFTNHTDKPIELVRPLDGSDIGRFPRFAWDVEAPENAAPVQPLGRCGNTNPITADAFFTVPAGDSVTLDLNWTPPPMPELNRGPGTYTLKATYSTDTDDLAGWIGGPLGGDALEQAKESIAPLLSHVPRVTIESNATEIRVVQSES
jgi:hypothetical protein